MTYENFILKYKDRILSPISESEFINLKSYITYEVRNVATFNGFNNINEDVCVNGIMFYLLQSKTYDDIMLNGYVDEIHKATMRYHNRVNGKSINAASKEEALSYINSSLLEIENIFDVNTDFNKLSTSIYSMLMNKGYTTEMIIHGRSDDALIDLIKNRKDYNQVSFSHEFNSLRNRVDDLTYDIFRKIYYDALKDYNLPSSLSEDKYIKTTAFRASLALFMEGYTRDNIDYKKLSTFIENDLKRIQIKNRSIYMEDKKENSRDRIDYERINKQKNARRKNDEENKKKIIIGIVIAVFILENLTYKIIDIHKDKQAEKEKNNSPKYEYSVSRQKEYSDDTVGNILRAMDNIKEKEREENSAFRR